MNTAISEGEFWKMREGTVLFKPQLGGWMLFIVEGGWLRCVDAYNRDERGTRYSFGAVGCLSPGYVIHEPPEIGYFAATETDSIATQNDRILKHEAETPMRGHDPNGQCCLRAKLGAGE